LRPLIATFRSDTDATDVEVFYAFPIEPVADQAASRAEVAVEAGVALHDADWTPVAQAADVLRLQLQPQQAPGNASLGQFSLVVPPDSYHVAVHVRPEGTPLIGGQRFDMRVPDYTQPEMAMSDVVPASQIETAAAEGPYVRHGWRITPNPTRYFPRTEPVHLYFELYNLLLNADDQTDYSIAYTLVSEKKPGLLRRIFGGGDRTALSITSPATGTEVSPVEVTQLDVSNVDPGPYRLTITVTDNQSNAQVSREQTIILY
jgi:hypothetical protein